MQCSCALSSRWRRFPADKTIARAIAQTPVPGSLKCQAIFFGVPGAQRLEGVIPETWRRDLYNWAVDLGISVKAYNRIARELGIQPFGGAMDLLLGDLALVTDVPEILGVPRDIMEAWAPGRSRRYSRAPRLRYVGAIYAQLFGELPGDVVSAVDLGLVGRGLVAIAGLWGSTRSSPTIAFGANRAPRPAPRSSGRCR